MELGKVVGQVVSTVRDPGLPNLKFLLVDIVDAQGKVTCPGQVAADILGAGEGEMVENHAAGYGDVERIEVPRHRDRNRAGARQNAVRQAGPFRPQKHRGPRRPLEIDQAIGAGGT